MYRHAQLVTIYVVIDVLINLIMVIAMGAPQLVGHCLNKPVVNGKVLCIKNALKGAREIAV